ncbi:hypothetical protein K504DRAFT_461602 [Pleomassaria siparia CBS 279.74]|uniref:DNA replication factor Cdt1 C-terminal domain-containing protein n=1 Tax=Pleomassaria siparia CBS 279.74 TaxID=1314801 RepID=A0A6G1KKD6_9PLEO|nr:hypothetical protein K504DRAFT_461602 [Pleomassaria siparia CBS 279.74]
MAPTQTQTETQTLPPDLVNLLALHSSFLTALSLHYAHNGTSVPVSIHDLLPSVSRIWRARNVTLEDLRLLLGVLNAGPAAHQNPFYLSDYSGGKICIEIRDGAKLSGALGSLNEDQLQTCFMDALDHLWTEWSTAQGSNTSTPTQARPIASPKRRGRPRKTVPTAQPAIQRFVDEKTLPAFLTQLPVAEITLCSSATVVAPLREKGRKRLREFKDSAQQGRAVKKARDVSFAIPATCTGKENEPAALTAQPKITEFASVRKSNLLDRLLAKQTLAAASPAPLSAPELARLSALQRSEEVLSIISLLAASRMPGTRVSFSMAALVQSLQGSMRSPLSREEVMKCVEVLAQEVVPGYLNLVKLGAMSSVVVNQAMRPGDVRGRLASLGVAI